MSQVRTPIFNPQLYPIPVDTAFSQDELYEVLHCFAEQDSYYIVFEEINSGAVGLRRFREKCDLGDFIDDLRENADNPGVVLFIFHGKHYPAIIPPGPVYGGAAGIESTTLNIVTLDENCSTYVALIGTNTGIPVDTEKWVASLTPAEPQHPIPAPEVAEIPPQDN